MARRSARTARLHIDSLTPLCAGSSAKPANQDLPARRSPIAHRVARRATSARLPAACHAAPACRWRDPSRRPVPATTVASSGCGAGAKALDRVLGGGERLGVQLGGDLVALLGGFAVALGWLRARTICRIRRSSSRCRGRARTARRDCTGCRRCRAAPPCGTRARRWRNPACRRCPRHRARRGYAWPWRCPWRRRRDRAGAPGRGPSSRPGPFPAGWRSGIARAPGLCWRRVRTSARLLPD